MRECMLPLMVADDVSSQSPDLTLLERHSWPHSKWKLSSCDITASWVVIYDHWNNCFIIIGRHCKVLTSPWLGFKAQSSVGLQLSATMWTRASLEESADTSQPQCKHPRKGGWGARWHHTTIGVCLESCVVVARNMLVSWHMRSHAPCQFFPRKQEKGCEELLINTELLPSLRLSSFSF